MAKPKKAAGDDDADCVPLTEAEREFLDRHSGIADRPGAYEEAVATSTRLRAAAVMPVVPHIDKVITALAADGQSTETFSVAAFVDYGIIEVPGIEESYTVRHWLESGRPPDLVLRLADQMKYRP